MEINKPHTILLTFDYELFLHRSGSVERCMLEPTNAILGILRQKGIKATFFVDILSLAEVRKVSGAQYASIQSQLLQMLDHGHRVELHLHPQWQEAEYDGKDWVFPRLNGTYRLQQFDSAMIESFFEKGADILHSITAPFDSNYQAIAFRAGGLCITPFAPLKSAFLKYNIRVDSSVAPGLYAHSDMQQYDFRQAPSQPYYFFEDNPVVPVANGSFLQIPISVMQLSLWQRIRARLFSPEISRGLSDTVFGDGKAVPPSVVSSNLYEKLSSRLKTQQYILSIDNLGEQDIFSHIRQSPLELFTILSHPKLMSKRSLTTLQALADHEFRFQTIAECYASLRQFP